MHMQQFQIGDVVKLKSGGPSMTVTAIDQGNGYVTASWFADFAEKPLWDEFHPATLEHSR